jgi:hypothetical protein
MASAAKLIKTAFKAFDALWTVLSTSNLNPQIRKFIITQPNAECVVLGNGPSLLATLEKEAEYLKGRKTCCVNQFLQSAYFEIIKPDYYVLVDPAFLKKGASDRINNIIVSMVNGFKQKVSWPMVLFLPVSAKNTDHSFTELTQSNTHIKICYVNLVSIDCYRKIKYWFYKKNLAMPLILNVLVAALFICLNLGFKTIFLTGADLSWHEDIFVGEDNVVYLRDKHFYDDALHFPVPFYKDIHEDKVFSMNELFLALSQMYLGFTELESYSKQCGKKIINISVKSNIDSFERGYKNT